jgi:quinolinate synthase
MIHPAFLADVLESLVAGEVINQIVVPKQIAEDAILALNRMLSITA